MNAPAARRYSDAWRRSSSPHVERARAYSADLEPWALGGGYLNYSTETPAEGLEATFGTDRLDRLRRVKQRYDPENVFRFNHNIEPAGS